MRTSFFSIASGLISATGSHSPRSRQCATGCGLGLAGFFATLVCGSSVWAAGGVLVLSTVDEATQSPVPARLVLLRSGDRPQLVRRLVSAGVGVVLDGQAELALPDGPYRFELTRGPEYRAVNGTFSLERTSSDSKQVALPRIVDMRREGWWSGDAAVKRPRRDLVLLMQSEDLHLVGLVDAQPDQRPAGPSPRAASSRDGGPERADADLLGPQWVSDDLHQIASGLFALGGRFPADALQTLPADQPSSLAIRQAVQHEAESIVVENPFAWDLPVWLASERIDAMVLMGGWLRLDRPAAKIPGRPPTEVGYLQNDGPGRWAEQVYWRLLEAGFRIAPLGASGTDPTTNPLGYNRTYVWLPPPASPGSAPPTAADWWDSALAGRSVVTNGPLLRPTLGGEPPGHRFTARTGEALEMSVELKLAVRDPVDYLDVIQNGEVVYSARLDEFARQGGMIPPLRFESSGWALVRVVTTYEGHWRAAVSAPWFVDFDNTPRISAAAVAFFRDWLSDREAMLAELPEAQLQHHVPFIRAARAFWQRRAESANAE